MVADLIDKVLPALIVSSLVSLGVSVKDQGVQQRLLEDNLKVTKELSVAVQDIQLNIAIFRERYVTKSEVEKMVEKREVPDGT